MRLHPGVEEVLKLFTEFEIGIHEVQKPCVEVRVDEVALVGNVVDTAYHGLVLRQNVLGRQRPAVLIVHFQDVFELVVEAN